MSRCGWTRSTSSTRSTSTYCETCWLSPTDPGVGDDAQRTQAQGTDQYPRRHGEPEKPPVDLAALTAAGQYLANDLCHGRELQQYIEWSPACRNRSGRQALYI